MADFPAPSPSPATGPAPATGTPATGPNGVRRSAGLVLLLSFVTFGIWIFVWTFQTGSELKRHTNRGLGGGVYLLITLLLAPVTMFLLPGEIEQMYKADGKQSPVSAMTGIWFLLPLIGNIVWYLKVQRALNDYWTARGTENKPGL